MLSFLIEDGCVVEKWVEKDSVEGNPYDIRVLTVNHVKSTHLFQRASHFVVRVGEKGIITNLHLGNRRGNLEEIKGRLKEKWVEMIDMVEEASRSNDLKKENRIP